MRRAVRPSSRLLFAALAALALAVPAVAREWNVGNVFKFNAEVVSYDGKKVKLKVTDTGQLFPVDVEKLSDADKQYLKTTYPDGLKEVKTSKPDKPADKPAVDQAAPGADPPADGAPAADPAEAKPAAKKVAARPLAKASADKIKPGKPGISVQVVSLTITKPSQTEGVQFSPPGTHITLLVADATRTLTGLDAEKCKITECIDDKRTDLAKPAEGEPSGDVAGQLTLDVSPDGKSGTIELHEPRVPAATATRIRIRGELVVLCGEGDSSTAVKVPLNIILGVGL